MNEQDHDVQFQTSDGIRLGERREDDNTASNGDMSRRIRLAARLCVFSATLSVFAAVLMLLTKHPASLLAMILCAASAIVSAVAAAKLSQNASEVATREESGTWSMGSP